MERIKRYMVFNDCPKDKNDPRPIPGIVGMSFSSDDLETAKTAADTLQKSYKISYVFDRIEGVYAYHTKF